MMLEPFETNQLLYILFFAFLAVTFIQLFISGEFSAGLPFIGKKQKTR